MHDFEIARRRVGASAPPFVIAEMSGNHGQSLDEALAIVDAAVGAGAHALKLQTYTADTMTLDISDREFLISDAASPWKGHSLYELYKKAHTPWEWHKEIFDRCRKHGMIGFSTPFDATAVDFLESLGVPCYKIASFENSDIPLIKRVAATRKPLFISTGLATVSELSDAVNAARDAGCRDLVLLKCTSNYPASPNSSNLLTIPHLKDLFACHAGLSDHTLGIGAAVASVALGAVAIEKHLTLSRKTESVDSSFSSEPHELRALVDESAAAWHALGSVHYGPMKEELPSKIFRRSLYVVKDMEASEVFTEANVRAIRPGLGLAPKYLDVILGKRVRCTVKKGTALRWDLVS